jgi:cell surface protein SprA
MVANKKFYDDTIKHKSIKAGICEKGRFVRLDTSNFTLDYNMGILQIKNLVPDRYYAVAYRIEGETELKEDDIYCGTLSHSAGERDTLVLKLVYRPNMRPEFSTLWSRMMKNCYSVGTKGSYSETGIKILYINDNNDTLEYLPDFTNKLVTVLGVDMINNLTGVQVPDGLFDNRLPFYSSKDGIVMFPSAEPFDTGINNYLSKSGRIDLLNKFTYPEVYTQIKTDAMLAKSKDNYLIRIERK